MMSEPAFDKHRFRVSGSKTPSGSSSSITGLGTESGSWPLPCPRTMHSSTAPSNTEGTSSKAIKRWKWGGSKCGVDTGPCGVGVNKKCENSRS